MAEQRFYNDDEAEEILKLAASKSESLSESGLTRDRLMQTAEELGISPDAVLAAEREIHDRKLIGAERSAYEAELKTSFFGHLFWYVAVNAFLMYTAMGQGKNWYLWVLAGWGIGLASHFYTTFLKPKAIRDQDFQNWRVTKRTTDSILESLGTTPEEILDKMCSGFDMPSKIDAIKAIRDQTGLGLAEAKAVVDDYARRHPGNLS